MKRHYNVQIVWDERSIACMHMNLYLFSLCDAIVDNTKAAEIMGYDNDGQKCYGKNIWLRQMLQPYRWKMTDNTLYYIDMESSKVHKMIRRSTLVHMWTDSTFRNVKKPQYLHHLAIAHIQPTSSSSLWYPLPNLPYAVFQHFATDIDNLYNLLSNIYYVNCDSCFIIYNLYSLLFDITPVNFNSSCARLCCRSIKFSIMPS